MSTPNASLERLPPEIRLNIYGYVLISDSTIEVCPKPEGLLTRVSSGFRINKDLHPPILSCCKLFRREATDIFYKNNNFQLDTSSGATVLPRFLRAIGKLNASSIRSFTINIVLYQRLYPKSAQTWEDLKTMSQLLIPEHQKFRTLRYELSPAEPCSRANSGGYPIGPNSHSAADSQYYYHKGIKDRLLWTLVDIRGNASVFLGDGSLSVGKIPRVTTGLVTDGFEIVTVTWQKNRSGIPVFRYSDGP